MSKGQERDIMRSEEEGMIRHEDYIPGGVSKEIYGFIIKVLDKFHEERHTIDLEQAAASVLSQMEEKERASVKTDDLRDVIRDIVGQAEWEELEHEELYRALDHDAYKGGVAG